MTSYSQNTHVTSRRNLSSSPYAIPTRPRSNLTTSPYSIPDRHTTPAASYNSRMGYTSPPQKGQENVPLLSREFVVRRISEGESGRVKHELKCEACGKGYKHISSLAKHLWEHTAEWNYTKKLLILKHQQVQLLEAASILVSMNEKSAQAPKPKPIPSKIPEAPNSQPSSMKRGSFSQSLPTDHIYLPLYKRNSVTDMDGLASPGLRMSFSYKRPMGGYLDGLKSMKNKNEGAIEDDEEEEEEEEEEKEEKPQGKEHDEADGKKSTYEDGVYGEFE